MGIAGNIANVLQRSAEVKGAAQAGDSFTEATITAQTDAEAGELAALGYVASPTSAWTGSQSIRVSGFRFFWNGTAWKAGTPSAPTPTGLQEEPTQYDPGDHTVAEVQDYVAAHPEEADAIYAAEQSGKARVTLLDWLAGPV